MTPSPLDTRLASARVAVGMLLVVTLGAIAWHLVASLPRARDVTDLPLLLAIFSAGIALPYAIALLLLAQRGGDGPRLAAGSALVNASWALPLGAILVLFRGFTMGNRDQEEAIAAVAIGALAQPFLLVAASIALRAAARGDGAYASQRRIGWPLALMLPIVASAASWALLRDQVVRLGERSEQAIADGRAAWDAVVELQACLAARRDRGYPAALGACPDAARWTAPRGYRVEYAPALPGADGRIGAYVLCATPERPGATGFEGIFADGSGPVGTAVATGGGCAALLGVERAIVYCAYAHAARDPGRGYPAHLADVASCVAGGRPIAVAGDRAATEQGETYAYLSDADAQGRIVAFRVYRLRGAIVPSPWIDDQGRSSRPEPPPDRALEALPAAADPERFAAGCAAGRAADCFYEGHEWQRRLRQRTHQEAARDAPEQRRALDAFARGCDLEESRACLSLASAVELGDGTAREPARAATLYERACELGSADGCRSAALIYETGRRGRPETLAPPPPGAARAADVPRDVPRAIRLDERACELGAYEGCFVAARLLAAEDTPGRDPEKALALFARLCADGLPSACLRAADLAPAARTDYARRACALGDPSACGGVALAK